MTLEQKLVFFIFSGLLGLLVGSFLNVCIFRLPRECMSIVRPRSRCNSCRAFIAWYDNIPVVSWLVLGGKCRHCRVKISPRYVLVELLTGAIFMWAAHVQLYHGRADWTWERGVWFGVQAGLAAALIVCTFIDLEFTILPDEITIGGFIIGIVAGTAFPFIYEMMDKKYVLTGDRLTFLPAMLRNPGSGLVHAVLGAIVGGGLIWLIGVLGKLAFRKEAMGFGDVKLMAFLGAFMGPQATVMSLFLAVFLGAMFGLGKLIVVRRMGYVPFGPFLSAGALIMVFAAPLIWSGVDAYIEFVRGMRE
jgi:leader peptidase (prepilin peptidase)/N-methyltransferase